ncbi:MAG: hypothetical protein WA432_03205 [Candidatus Babeliaceae bacterium]
MIKTIFQKIFMGILITVLVITTLILCYAGYRYYTLTTLVRYATQQKIKQEFDSVTKKTELIFTQAEQQAQTIVDLLKSAPTEEILTQKINALLQENPLMMQVIVSFDNKQLRFTKNQSSAETITEKEPIPVSPGTWSEPYFSSSLGKEIISYETTDGKIMISLDMAPITTNAQQWDIHTPGYSFVLNTKGKFMYHPVHTYVVQHKTIFNLAKEFQNRDFTLIGKKLLEKKQNQFTYTDSLTKEPAFAYSRTTKQPAWIFVILFSEAEIPFEKDKVQNYRFWMLVLIMIILISILFLYSNTIIQKHHRYITASIGISLIIMIGIIFLTYFIQLDSAQQNEQKPITDQKTLDTQLAEYKKKHPNETAIIQIPTGIYIYSLFIPAVQRIFLTGYVWQKYKKNDGIERGFRFPEATKITIKKGYQVEQGDTEIIGWQVRAELYQEFNYTQYPFDHTVISIALEHPDITKHIVLVPDVNAYDRLAPTAIPGIDVSLNLSGFQFLNSYFAYKSYLPDTNFGLQNYKETAHDERLSFNITLKRGLLNAFIMYYLPLIVILISMFAVICLVEAYRRHTETHAFSSLASYTALFFSTILVHSTLRSEFKVGEVLYIEYLFFLTYLILLVLQIYALFTALNKTEKRITFPYVELLYWPVTLAIWFIITFYVFY